MQNWIVPLQTVILGICGWILLKLYNINRWIGEILGALDAVNLRIDAHIREDDILHINRSIGEILGALDAVNLRIDAHIREDDILHGIKKIGSDLDQLGESGKTRR